MTPYDRTRTPDLFRAWLIAQRDECTGWTDEDIIVGTSNSMCNCPIALFTGANVIQLSEDDGGTIVLTPDFEHFDERVEPESWVRDFVERVDAPGEKYNVTLAAALAILDEVTA